MPAPTYASQSDLANLKTQVDLLSKRADLTRIPLDLDAALVTVKTAPLADAITPVTHGLKRTPTGYIVCRMQGGKGTVYEPTATPAWSSTTLFLACSTGGLTLTLLVF